MTIWPSPIHQRALKSMLGAILLLAPIDSNADVLTPEQPKRPGLVRDESTYRGWGYLVEKLRADGVSETQVSRVYLDRRMPQWSFVPFGLKPRETSAMYAGFLSKAKVQMAREFTQKHSAVLREAEREMGVDRRVIAAILLIETQFGRVTGRERVINRLSRLAGIGEPRNLLFNFRRHRELDPSVTFEQVESRARYLETTFYPEVPALLKIAKQRGLDPLEIRGSSAGAFGWPQFLPTTMLRFGVDGDDNRAVSLFVAPDAIWSTANFLNHLGWKNSGTREEKLKALWGYNKSTPYGETVLAIAERL